MHWPAGVIPKAIAEYTNVAAVSQPPASLPLVYTSSCVRSTVPLQGAGTSRASGSYFAQCEHCKHSTVFSESCFEVLSCGEPPRGGPGLGSLLLCGPEQGTLFIARVPNVFVLSPAPCSLDSLGQKPAYQGTRSNRQCWLCSWLITFALHISQQLSLVACSWGMTWHEASSQEEKQVKDFCL